MANIKQIYRLSNPSPAVARTTAALIATIAAALEHDGDTIDPGSIDSQGLSVVSGQFRWRIELDEPELLDSDHFCGPECYDCQNPCRCTAVRSPEQLWEEFVREEDRARQEAVDRDWMSDTWQDIEF